DRTRGRPTRARTPVLVTPWPSACRRSTRSENSDVTSGALSSSSARLSSSRSPRLPFTWSVTTRAAASIFRSICIAPPSPPPDRYRAPLRFRTPGGGGENRALQLPGPPPPGLRSRPAAGRGGGSTRDSDRLGRGGLSALVPSRRPAADRRAVRQRSVAR